MMKKIKEALSGGIILWCVKGIIVITVGAALVPITIQIVKHHKNNANPKPEVTVETENGEEWNGDMPLNGVDVNEQVEVKGIEIPGYSELYGPEVQLINPSGNDVYFVYKIFKGGALIHETKLISPNQTVTLPVNEILGAGTHSLEFRIETYDIETMNAQNGAILDVTIINK